jgi:hypothetical protein
MPGKILIKSKAHTYHKHIFFFLFFRKNIATTVTDLRNTVLVGCWHFVRHNVTIRDAAAVQGVYSLSPGVENGE